MADTGLNRSKTWYPSAPLNTPSPSTLWLFLIVSREGFNGASNTKPALNCFDHATMHKKDSRSLIVIKTFSPCSSAVSSSMPMPLSVTFRNIASTCKIRSFDIITLISRLGRSLLERFAILMGASAMIMFLRSSICMRVSTSPATERETYPARSD